MVVLEQSLELEVQSLVVVVYQEWVLVLCLVLEYFQELQLPQQ